MVKRLVGTVALLLTAFTGHTVAEALTFTGTAGDLDFAATRNAFDTTSNMDYYVFRAGSGQSGAATNSLGFVNWGYTLPNAIVTAQSGSMTVRAWDIDTGDIMNVYFDLGGSGTVFAGQLTGSNGGTVTTWENAVAGGTTAALGGWSTTTFTLDAATLAAISGTSGFTLLLEVTNVADNWAAVIDYATLNLTYEPGAANPSIPAPASLALLGVRLAGVGYLRRRSARG